ncbi:hypothetical protein M5E88_08670 [Akkermansia muciniphila]|nr:hypothetical protein M5E88_08670 [Akkermansia muciniphila]
MKIREGTQRIDNGTKKAIIEFVFDDYIIYVFQGALSQFDIVIKYKKDGMRIRTPKHIHWVVDILMKMQGNEVLTKQYLEAIQNCWNTYVPLTNNNFDTLKVLIEKGENEINIAQYFPLNTFGEYNVEFLYVLMELLAVQEKQIDQMRICLVISSKNCLKQIGTSLRLSLRQVSEEEGGNMARNFNS